MKKCTGAVISWLIQQQAITEEDRPWQRAPGVPSCNRDYAPPHCSGKALRYSCGDRTPW